MEGGTWQEVPSTVGRGDMSCCLSLSECSPSWQVNLQVPLTVCLSHSILPLGGASRTGSQLRAANVVMC